MHQTTFSFYNIIYEQKDGISMGSSHGYLMSNTIMIELENGIIKPLMTDGTTKFWYGNDTYILIVLKISMVNITC